MHILVNCSNFCTLLHPIVHNAVDQFCCSLQFLPAGSWLLAFDCCSIYCPTRHSLPSHSNQWLHWFTVNNHRQQPLFCVAACSLVIAVRRPSRFYMKPFIHFSEVVVNGYCVIALLPTNLKWLIKTTLMKNGIRENKLIFKTYMSFKFIDLIQLDK